MAVLYRTNAQSRAIEESLVRWGIPYIVVELRFYDRREIKDLLAYLRLLVNPADTASCCGLTMCQNEVLQDHNSTPHRCRQSVGIPLGMW